MSDYRHLIIEPLDRRHDRTRFQCGESSLDAYLKKQARQDIKRRISRVFVATVAEGAATIVGYYTLSSLSIELQELPEPMARRLPRHPLPVALIGRLAVSRQARGRGVGKMLVADAIKRVLAVGDEIAIHAIVVDAIEAEAMRFYRKFGFFPLESHARRLFLPLNAL